MLLYAFLVFLQARTLVQCSEVVIIPLPEYNERMLSTETIDFRKVFDNEFKHWWITKETIDSFKKNLRILLEFLSNIHHSTVFDEETVDMIRQTDESRRYTYTFKKTEFEKAVCRSLPQCVDFIFEMTGDVSELFDLYRFYDSRCVSWTAAIQSVCTVDENTHQLSYDPQQITVLHRHVVFYSDRNMPEGFAEMGIQFAKDAVKYVSRINVIATATHLKNDFPMSKNLFGETAYGFASLRNKFAEHEPRDGAKKSELDAALKSLNEAYGKTVSEDPKQFATVADAVNRLVACALRTLRVHLQLETTHVLTVKTKGTRAAKYSHKGFVDEVKTMFAEVCDKTPLLVVYLTANCEDDAAIKVPLGLHLTYCADWQTILETRCPPGEHAPGTEDQFTERSCMVSTVIDRLDAGVYRVVGAESAANETELPDDKRFVEASDYLAGVYGKVAKYYAGDAAVPVWSAPDWMTGRPFLSLFGAQNVHLLDSLNLGRDVGLLETYNVAVPWMSTADTVLRFRETIAELAERFLFKFVLRHVHVIALYADCVRSRGVADYGSVERPRIPGTIKWYTEGAKTAVKYLSFPVDSGRSYVESANALSSFVLSVNRNTQLAAFRETLKNNAKYPGELLDELNRWSQARLASPDYKDVDVEVQLDTLLVENCRQAGLYVNWILDAARESGFVTNAENVDMDNAYCFKNVSKTFSNATIEKVPEIGDLNDVMKTFV